MSTPPDPAPSTPVNTPPDQATTHIEGGNRPQEFRTSRDRTRNRGLLMRMFGSISSIWGAAILLSLLIVVTGIATYYERDYGRELVALKIYHTWWFAAIFGLLALNIFGAAAVRFPWKKQQAGFVITHCGLLTVMLGFVVATNDRLDGMLGVGQGESAHSIELERELLTVVHEPSDQRQDYRFKVLHFANYPGFWRYTGDLILRNTTGHRLVHKPMVSPATQRIPLGDKIAGHPIYLRRVVSTAEQQLTWEPSHDGREVVRFRMTTEGEMFGFEDGRAREVVLPRGQRVELGPLHMRHHQQPLPPAAQALLEYPLPDEGLPPQGRLLLSDGNGQIHQAVVDMTPGEDEEEVSHRVDEHLGLRFIAYQPHIEIEEGGGFRRPSNDPLAPFLVFRLGVGADDERQWTNDILADGLSFFPTPVGEGMWALWQHPTAWEGYHKRSLGSSIDFMHLENGEKFILRASNHNGFTHARVVGEDGWQHRSEMGLGGVLMEYIGYWENAAQVPQPVAMNAMERHRASNWIEVQVGEGTQAPRTWIRRGSATSVTLPSGQDILLSYRREIYDLLDMHGFSVRLNRFVNEKDPGGISNASYASDVTVRYADGREPTNHVISMNEPLDKGGVTLYQTSRAEQPDGTFVSFFTVAQDPGRPFKYLGSLILVAGIITMYVMKARARRPRRSAAQAAPSAPPAPSALAPSSKAASS